MAENQSRADLAGPALWSARDRFGSDRQEFTNRLKAQTDIEARCKVVWQMKQY